MKKCPTCGKDVPTDDAELCDYCDVEVFCGKCGKSLAPGKGVVVAGNLRCKKCARVNGTRN